jgi:hypothetical protein
VYYLDRARTQACPQRAVHKQQALHRRHSTIDRTKESKTKTKMAPAVSALKTGKKYTTACTHLAGNRRRNIRGVAARLTELQASENRLPPTLVFC